MERTPDQEAANEALVKLVRQCMAGDSQSWQQLVVSQHRRIYAICYRFTGSGNDAEDLTQEVFLKLYKNLASFDTQKGSFQTWITTLARNLLVDHFRRTRLDRASDSLDATFDGEDDGPTMADRLADPRPSQEQHVAGLELKVRVQHALKQLSPELREAVILRDLEDMDYKEISQVLRIPEGTVKSRISRGRGELARLLQRIEGQVIKVADFNQFGSAKPGNLGGPGNSQHCAQCEAMLSDALDGALSATDQATFDLHLAGCPSCAGMFADAQRGIAWMEMLKSPRPEPPTALLERIIAQTSGQAQAAAANKSPIVLGSNDRLRTPGTLPGRPALVPSAITQPAFSTNVLPFRTRITHAFRSLGQTMLQPRLAMTAAMAFFSIALTLNLTGVRLSALRASDFKPSSIMRSASQAKASVVRYTDNLRVVYELESRVRDLQRSSDDDASSGAAGSTPTPANQNNPGQKPDGSQQPDDQNQKPGSQKQNQKQTRPNPGSSRRETPRGSIQLVQSVRTQAPPFSLPAFVFRNPSVIQQGGGLV